LENDRARLAVEDTGLEDDVWLTEPDNDVEEFVPLHVAGATPPSIEHVLVEFGEEPTVAEKLESMLLDRFPVRRAKERAGRLGPRRHRGRREPDRNHARVAED